MPDVYMIFHEISYHKALIKQRHVPSLPMDKDCVFSHRKYAVWPYSVPSTSPVDLEPSNIRYD